MRRATNLRLAGTGAMLLAAAMLLMAAVPAQAIDLDKLNKVQKLQQQSTLAEARKAVGEGDYGRAQRLVEEARRQSYDPAAVAEVERLVTDGRRRQEEQARRAEEEKARQATAAAASATASAGAAGR